MSNYTEADVNEAAQLVEEGLHTTTKVNPRKDVWLPKLAFLKAAALEGAKVPGLVADNAALLAIIRRLHYRSGEGCDICDAMDAEHPGAALLAEHAAKVSALQAQVKELERQRDADKAWAKDCEDANAIHHDLLQKEKVRAQSAESERDALRAQVERLTYERDTARLAVLEVVAPESKRPASLSAPPAETALNWDSPGDLRDLVALCLRPETDTIIRAYTEGDTTFEFDSSELAALARPPAKTTPAPERKRRSCNLHADCDAEPGECCNSSDCPDHQ